MYSYLVRILPVGAYLLLLDSLAAPSSLDWTYSFIAIYSELKDDTRLLF